MSIKLDLKPSLISQEFAPIIRRFGIEGTWGLQLAWGDGKVGRDGKGQGWQVSAMVEVPLKTSIWFMSVWFSHDFQYVMYIYTYTYRYINFRWHSELCLWANKIALRCQVSPRSTSSVLQDLGAFGWAGISLLVVSDRYVERCQPSKI